MTGIAAPRVTVISAWYNRTADLELSVRSILDQEGVEFEFVIVDDCSTDDTAARLAGIAHPRLRVLRNATNLGFTGSIRRAAAEARGDFIAVHGAGDLSLPGRLASQVALLDVRPEAVAAGVGVVNHDLASGRRETIVWPAMESGQTIYTHGEVMYRRADYEAVGGYRQVFHFAQDSDLWRRLGERGRLLRVEEVFYERRIFADGVAGDRGKEVMQAVFSNLGVHAAIERAAGRRDPVDRWNAAALLRQGLTPRFQARGTYPIKMMLKERRFAEAKAALDVVPLGLLTWKLLLVYLLLAPFHPRPKLAPVPPVETWRPDGQPR